MGDCESLSLLASLFHWGSGSVFCCSRWNSEVSVLGGPSRISEVELA
jgi:hypothetical protein